jgi:hypothetical protein
MFVGLPPFFWCLAEPGYIRFVFGMTEYGIPLMLFSDRSFIAVLNVPFLGFLPNSSATNLCATLYSNLNVEAIALTTQSLVSPLAIALSL